MTPRIACTKSSITELVFSYATDAARNGWGYTPISGGLYGNKHCSGSMACL